MPIRREYFTPGFMSSNSLVADSHGKSGMIRVSDLPIYEEPSPVENRAYYVEPTPTPFLLQKISELRHATSHYWTAAENVRNRVRDTYDTGKAHSQNALDIVRDESRGLPRAIFISSGALLGLLAATRRGFIRKLLYTGIGAAIPAAVCYPQASKELARTGFARAKELSSNLKSYTNQTINKVENSEKSVKKFELIDETAAKPR